MNICGNLNLTALYFCIWNRTNFTSWMNIIPYICTLCPFYIPCADCKNNFICLCPRDTEQTLVILVRLKKIIANFRDILFQSWSLFIRVSTKIHFSMFEKSENLSKNQQIFVKFRLHEYFRLRKKFGEDISKIFTSFTFLQYKYLQLISLIVK